MLTSSTKGSRRSLFFICSEPWRNLTGMAHRRILSAQLAAEALQAAGQCRALCVQVLTEVPINGPAYRAAAEVAAAIDGLAEVLIDDRAHFHLRPHGGSVPGPRG